MMRASIAYKQTVRRRYNARWAKAPSVRVLVYYDNFMSE